MIIRNTTQGSIISSEAGVAVSFLSRLVGLMLSKPRDLVLISPQEDIKSSSIHMMFMLYPIDVIWLNSKREVVEVRRDVQPFNPINLSTWRIYRPKKPAKYVIELGRNRLIPSQEPMEGDLTDLTTP